MGLQLGSPPHTFATPPPPQVADPAQAPQSRLPPQPSPMLPQYCPPACVQASGTQLAGAMHSPLSQDHPLAQAPQSSLPKGQPLPMVPQYCPPGCVQAIGVQTAASIPVTVVPAAPEAPPPEIVPAAPAVPLRPPAAPPVPAPLPPPPLAALLLTPAQAAASRQKTLKRTNGRPRPTFCIRSVGVRAYVGRLSGRAQRPLGGSGLPENQDFTAAGGVRRMTRSRTSAWAPRAGSLSAGVRRRYSPSGPMS